MKRIATLLAVAAGLGLAPAGMARVSHGYHVHHAREYGPHSGGHYHNVSGDWVHSPMHSSHRPAAATAHCADGSWSFSRHRRGTCSHHGGIS